MIMRKSWNGRPVHAGVRARIATVTGLLALSAVLMTAGCGDTSTSTGTGNGTGGGSGASSPRSTTPSEGATKKRAFMVIGVPGDAKTLDPALSTDTESGQVNEMIYEGLLKFDRASLDLVPGVAESWTVSPDGLVWTFQVRRNVTFHDGTPVDADAVISSFMRQIDEKHPHHRGGGKMQYREAFYTEIIDRIERLGDFEVAFHLKEPFVSFGANLACDPSAIVSPTALEKWGEDFEANPSGTGPYMLRKWNKGTEIQLVAYPGYWGEPAATPTLYFKVYEEPAQRYNALLVDEVQVITSVDPSYVAMIEKNPDMVVYRRPALSISYLELNVSKPPLDNRLFRQALNYAVDKEFIVNKLMAGVGYVSVGALPPGMEGALAEPVFPYDPDKARALLKESGVDLAKTVLQFQTYKRTRPYNPVGDRLATVCQQYFEEVGLKVTMDVVDFTKYLDDRVAGESMIGNIGWSSDNGQADNTIYELWGKPSNLQRYKNDEALALMKEAMITQDAAARDAIYRRANQMVVDDGASVWLNHGMQIQAGRKTVRDFQLHPKGTHKFEYAWDER